MPKRAPPPTLIRALLLVALQHARGSESAPLCAALEPSAYIRECSPAPSEWHGSVYVPSSEVGVCTVLAQTDGTCAAWCGSHGMRCVRGQNNAVSAGCALDSSLAGGAGSGCYESWADQVCACNAPPPPPPPPPPRCRADICGDHSDDCCAPGTEARVCLEDGYDVTPGGTSSYLSCPEEGIYQCCQPAVLVDVVSQLPCSAEDGAAVPFAAHTRPLRLRSAHGGSGVRLRRWTGDNIDSAAGNRAATLDTPDLTVLLVRIAIEMPILF